MNAKPPKIFIQDQQLSKLVLLPEDNGDKLKFLREQHGGEAWSSHEEFEKFTNEQRRKQPRWHAIGNRLGIFPQFQSRDRVLLAVTAYAGIGKSMVIHQIDGLLPFACEGMDVIRVEFSHLPNDWLQYLHKPWNGDEPFFVRMLYDAFGKHKTIGHELPAINTHDLRQWVEAKIRTGSFVLAVDSLDEHNAPDAATKARELKHLLFNVFPKLHCVVAGRPHAITQQLWLPLFADSHESEKISPRSAWEFMRVEMFDRQQLERFIGKELADQLKILEADIELSPRNLEALRTLDDSTRNSIRSTADLYWHSIVKSLPEDNKEGRGNQLVHTNLKVEEILHMLSAIGVTMALWNDDPRFPIHHDVGTEEFGALIDIPKTRADDRKAKSLTSNPGEMQFGGNYAPPIEEFRRRLFERLLEVYPFWREVESKSQRQLIELRLEELIKLNSQYVEFGFFEERDPQQVRWRNENLRDFFAALWVCTRANAVERDAYHQRIDIARDVRDSSIARTWQMICGMPIEVMRLCDGANDPTRNLPWLRMIAPIYKTSAEEERFRGRPTELMYRAWSGLLKRAGFLREANWSEYDLLMATTVAQRYFEPKPDLKMPRVVFKEKDKNASRIVGSFLQQYPLLRDGHDERSRIIAEDLENTEDLQNHWCDCDSRAGMTVQVGHIEYSNNVEHDEVLQHAFSLCAYPVTNRLYDLFDASHRFRFGKEYRKYSPEVRCPAIFISWYDAMMFSIWCHGYLPSEWEWEYASRAKHRNADGRNSIYHWGDDESRLGEHAWVRRGHTRPVGNLKANKFGLHDTLGNVWEWCRNRYATERRAWGEDGPSDDESLVLRVLRGGSFFFGAFRARCSIRNRFDPSIAYTSFGLRVSRARHP